MLERILFNVLQVAVVLIFAPLASGVLSRLKEMVQSKRGPSIFQPYRDLWKLFHKDEIVSEDSSWIFRFAPYVIFVAPIFVALLIPVLTRYPLFFGFMGDMLGVGFVLALGGFFATLAAVDTANPFGPIGASRTRMVGFLAEPVFMIVFFTLSFVAGSTIPYIVQQKWVTPLANFFSPSHVLLLLAFVMLILAEAGRIPVDNPTGHFELAMIDESKSLEYSGRGFALVKWGGQMKFFVLMCIFLNVLVTPWGLAGGQNLGAVLLAIPIVLFKVFCFLLVMVLIESSLSKLRLFRIAEFLGAAFITSVAAMIAQVFCPERTMSSATKLLLENLNALAAGLFLLTAFGIVAVRQARGCLNLFIVQSLLLAASAALLGLRYDSSHLYGVALVNLISKPIIVPWLLHKTSPAEIYTRREIDQVLNIPTALLIALALVIAAYFAGIPLANAIGPEFRGPNVPIGIAVLLLGAFTLTVRREALSLLIGLLVMENGAFLAGISIARDLGTLVELAIATDGLVIVFIMGVLVRAVQKQIGSTAVGALASLKETDAAPEADEALL